MPRRLRARLIARLRASSLDRQLAVGVAPAAGSALAAHRARIVAPPERHAVARTLSESMQEAGHRGTLAEDLSERLIQRLYAPGPVCERGMARLRLLLSDGSGPLYRCGRGDLSGRLGAALAEL